MLVILAGCAGGRSTTRPTAAAPSTTAARRPQPVTLADVRQCQVTPSQRRHPAWSRAWAGVNHGNTKLWTALWPGGVIKADPDHMDKDGFIHVTFGAVARVSGRLSIQGRRLDASARRLGLRSRAAMATVASRLVGVSFPAGGCWEIIGQVGAARLTLVNFVIRV